jgi:hypothetical protein
VTGKLRSCLPQPAVVLGLKFFRQVWGKYHISALPAFGMQQVVSLLGQGCRLGLHGGIVSKQHNPLLANGVHILRKKLAKHSSWLDSGTVLRC